MEKKGSAEKAVREIRRKTRRRFLAEDKTRIVIEGPWGEELFALGSVARELRRGLFDAFFYGFFDLSRSHPR